MGHYAVQLTAYRDGEAIRTFQSMQEACEWLGGYRMSNLSTHLSKGHPKQIHGYVFRRIERPAPPPFDWAPYVEYIYWWSHQATKKIVKFRREEAREFDVGYICQHLPQYRGGYKPETHIQHSAEWGVQVWLKKHWHPEEILLSDEGWRTIAEEVPE